MCMMRRGQAQDRNIVRQVGRLLDGVRSSRPAELVHFLW